MAGAAGNAVSYAITSAQTGQFSWSRLGKNALAGAAVGGLTGGLAEGAAGAVGGLLSSGAEDAASALSSRAADEVTSATSEAAATTADSTGRSVAEDAAARSDGEESARSESCLTPGGQSFTAGTKVLTASGALVAISKLKPGDKVLATNTSTGKTQAEPVAAVLVHYDKNLYDLKVRAAGHTAVIHTTRSHLFWNQSIRRWVKAAALKDGTHQRTPSGAAATVVGGWTPKVITGWMWDLTIPGNNDFYVAVLSPLSDGGVDGTNGVVNSVVAVLVHNCSSGQIAYNSDELSQAAYKARGPAGINPGANVAAAKVPGWNDPETGDIVVGFSKRFGYHSEDHIMDQLTGRGFDPEQIMGLYSDRQPCSECNAMLDGPLGALKPGTPVSWSVPWGDDPDLRDASNDLLRSLIRQADAGRGL